jgi:hypothetical protein
MKLRIFYMPEGQGNISYDFPPDTAPGVLNAANDGLSTDAATGKIAQLGQTVGRVGNPAGLLETRELPMNGHRFFFGKDDGVSGVVGIDADDGISVSNAAGDILQAFNSSDNMQMQLPALGQFLIDFNAGDIQLLFDDNIEELSTNRVFRTGGLRVRSGVIHGPTSFNPAPTTVFFLCDTSGGNIVINLDPAAVNALGNNFLVFKKTTADLNTVTLQPTSGTIQEIGAPAASFVFNTQGQSVTVIGDGTNFYIV